MQSFCCGGHLISSKWINVTQSMVGWRQVVACSKWRAPRICHSPPLLEFDVSHIFASKLDCPCAWPTIIHLSAWSLYGLDFFCLHWVGFQNQPLECRQTLFCLLYMWILEQTASHPLASLTISIFITLSTSCYMLVLEPAFISGFPIVKM